MFNYASSTIFIFSKYYISYLSLLKSLNVLYESTLSESLEFLDPKVHGLTNVLWI